MDKEMIMKKIPIVAMLFLMSAAALFAQDAGKFTFGGRGGLMYGFHKAGSDIRNLFGGYTPTDESLFNPDIVIYGNYAVTDKIVMQGELNLMINQGMKFTIFGYNVNGTGISLDIPVLLKVALMTDPAGYEISF